MNDAAELSSAACSCERFVCRRSQRLYLVDLAPCSPSCACARPSRPRARRFVTRGRVSELRHATDGFSKSTRTPTAGGIYTGQRKCRCHHCAAARLRHVSHTCPRACRAHSRSVRVALRYCRPQCTAERHLMPFKTLSRSGRAEMVSTTPARLRQARERRQNRWSR